MLLDLQHIECMRGSIAVILHGEPSVLTNGSNGLDRVLFSLGIMNTGKIVPDTMPLSKISMSED